MCWYTVKHMRIFRVRLWKHVAFRCADAWGARGEQFTNLIYYDSVYLRLELLPHKVDTSYNGKVPSMRNKAHPLYGMAFYKEVPEPSHDIVQKTASLYMPPGCYIWRANTRGAWYVHVRPHNAHAETWANHQHDSFKAMIAACRFAWSQWLEDHGLDESHCPIKGIFWFDMLCRPFAVS